MLNKLIGLHDNNVSCSNVTVGKYDFNDEAFDNVSPECIDFITKCLMKPHGERLTAKEALKHKWIKRKPQYHPSNQKTSHPLAFKAVYLDKVRQPKHRYVYLCTY